FAATTFRPLATWHPCGVKIVCFTPVTLGSAAPQSRRVPCSRAPIPDLLPGAGRWERPGHARLAVRGPELTAVRLGEFLCQWSRTAALAQITGVADFPGATG